MALQAAWRCACLATLAAMVVPAGARGPVVFETGERTGIGKDDGWASLPTVDLPRGTTGGAAASAARTHDVRNRDELIAALRYPDPTAKLVRVLGRIDVNVDADNKPLSCSDYARSDPETGTAYALSAFTAAFDPATWGRRDAQGPLERARKASAAAQLARVQVRIPPNTTLIGIGRDATLAGTWLDIRPPRTEGNAPANVIVRNLTFEETYDCFPEWSPNDGDTGNWNAQYDAISVRNATHVWIDHNRMSDAAPGRQVRQDVFGRPYQVHDGLIDISNAADLVTVSWNLLADHDKTMLVGSSDKAVDDRGRLRVTLHHNHFLDLGQRVPRVRFGQVLAYNNLYETTTRGAAAYHYSWGLGIESLIDARSNHFVVPPAISADQIIEVHAGTRIAVDGTLRNGEPVDPVAAYTSRSGRTLLRVDTDPAAPHLPIEPAARVPDSVRAGAGPRR